MKIKTKIKDYRISADVTQKVMAEVIGCSLQSYSKYELGQREPSIEVLIRLADYFCISVDELLGHKVRTERAKTSDEHELEEEILPSEHLGEQISQMAVIKKDMDREAAVSTNSNIVIANFNRFYEHADLYMVKDAYREIFYLNHVTGADVALLCRAFGVSRSGYYHYVKYGDAVRARNEAIAIAIEKLEFPSMNSAGYEAVTRYLRNDSTMPELKNISVARVKRIMDEFEIIPEDLRSKKDQILQSFIGKYSVAKERNARPNFLRHRYDYDCLPLSYWCIDITEIRTEERKFYMCAVMDLCGRYLISYSTGLYMNKALVRRAMNMANSCKRSFFGDGKIPVIVHSDRGAQFQSGEFQESLEKSGMVSSMSKPLHPNDNACIESFFASLKCEYLYRYDLETVDDAIWMIRRYVKFFNEIRIHETVGEAPYDFWLRGIDALRTAELAM